MVGLGTFYFGPTRRGPKTDRDGNAKSWMVSQRFSRSDFNCPELPWTASWLTELRDTPPSAPSPEELPQCLNEAILRAFPSPRGFRLLGTSPLHGSSPTFPQRGLRVHTPIASRVNRLSLALAGKRTTRAAVPLRERGPFRESWARAWLSVAPSAPWSASSGPSSRSTPRPCRPK